MSICSRVSAVSKVLCIILLLHAYVFFQSSTFALIPAPVVSNVSSVRICTQNLQQWGTPFVHKEERIPEKRKKTRQSNTIHRQQKTPDKNLSAKKEKYLVTRMVTARCDVIAVQEVFGNNSQEALIQLDRLAKTLSNASGRTFESYVGNNTMNTMHVGFLIASEKLAVQKVYHFDDFPLPKLQPISRPLYFRRNPLGILLRLPSQTNITQANAPGLVSEFVAKKCIENNSPEQMFLLTAHFKSKVESWKDPTETQFEVMRMEMAEGLRQIIENKITDLGEGTIILALGDWNSDPQSATAQIISGVRRLGDFSSRSGCFLNEKIRPVCPPGSGNHPAVLQGLFGDPSSSQDKSKRRDKNNSVSNDGSYRYKGVTSFIDQIFVQPKDLWRFSQNNTPDTGIEGVFYKGSDHKLLWTALHLCPDGS